MIRDGFILILSSMGFSYTTNEIPISCFWFSLLMLIGAVGEGFFFLFFCFFFPNLKKNFLCWLLYISSYLKIGIIPSISTSASNFSLPLTASLLFLSLSPPPLHTPDYSTQQALRLPTSITTTSFIPGSVLFLF